VTLLLVALLGDEGEVVPEEEKLMFFAQADLGVRFPIP
jgi:hypothetical protein